jgi:ADP-ribosylglycohydrolase
MTRSQQNRVAGALCGLAIGDALGRDLGGKPPPELHSEQSTKGAEPPLVHGAATTWTLAILDALLFRRHDEGLRHDLALRLQVLSAPMQGRALRGAPQRLKNTLLASAARLASGDDPRWAGADDVLADGVFAALPFAFALGDSDEDVLEAMVDAVLLTHRHVRVLSSAGLWLGGLRSWLRNPKQSHESALEDAEAFAQRTLAYLQAEHAGHTKGRRLEAEGALALSIAQAQMAPSALDLLTPPGFDGRDAPERLVLAALRFAPPDALDLASALKQCVDAGGDVDISAPLLAASRGLLVGLEHLPLGLLGRLKTRALLKTRAQALFEARPPRVPPLIDEELRFSLYVHEGREQTPAPIRESKPGRAQKQLKLL